MKSIPTCIPGLRIGEGIPDLAPIMDRLTVVRSVTHPYAEHGVAYAVSGIPPYTPMLETRPRDPRHWPFFGSAVEYADAATGRTVAHRRVPANMALPFRFSSRRVGEVPRAGPYAAFLGSEFDPVWTDYVGTATKCLPKTLTDKRFDENDPYIGLDADSHKVLLVTATAGDDDGRGMGARDRHQPDREVPRDRDGVEVTPAVFGVLAESVRTTVRLAKGVANTAAPVFLFKAVLAAGLSSPEASLSAIPGGQAAP